MCYCVILTCHYVLLTCHYVLLCVTNVLLMWYSVLLMCYSVLLPAADFRQSRRQAFFDIFYLLLVANGMRGRRGIEACVERSQEMVQPAMLGEGRGGERREGDYGLGCRKVARRDAIMVQCSSAQDSRATLSNHPRLTPVSPGQTSIAKAWIGFRFR